MIVCIITIILRLIKKLHKYLLLLLQHFYY